MLKSYLIFVTLCSVVFFTACADGNTSAQAVEKDVRVITLSGFLTELVFALGHGDKIVGCDVTSAYPEATDSIPNLGHISQLNAEAILGLKPDLLFVEEKQAESIKFLNQLEQAGAKIVIVPTRLNFDNSIVAANLIKEYLPVEENVINRIGQKLEADSLALEDFKRDIGISPPVLFLYARGAGNVMAGGAGTSASVMIEKAGARNAMNGFENFRAVTAEGLIESAPEVVLLFTGGLRALQEGKGLGSIPGMSQTPAFKSNRIIEMEGHYLTSFGPRSAAAALELSKKIFE